MSDGRASVHEPVLKGLNGALKDRRFLLRSGRQTVGRRPGNDIVIEDASVSASHAWIVNQHGHYVVMNTLSTNGTYVNGKRIHEAVLKHGDRLHFGHTEFEFLTRERGNLTTSWRWAAALAVAGILLIALLVYGFA
ncbi:FHA domain-containing protein [Dyella jejuensis]|uniref:FHA domain-containing protein n=1 Tax=Dyella jejuensis TaxID=1432009 RepID=UPI00384BE9CB